MALEDLILSILRKSPSDQYTLFRQAESVKMSEITKALADLQRSSAIHITGYRKSPRSGFDIPIYSIRAVKKARLDFHPLLSGVTSERLVEYDFVARHFVSTRNRSTILDIGTGSSGLTKAIREFGRGKWMVIGLDLADLDCDARMDARSTAFRNETFDQIICISTIEHIGIHGVKDTQGDRNVMEEISRILKKEGSAIVSVPYGKNTEVKQGYRIYDRQTLAKLAGPLSIEKKEFYRYSSGKWIRCSETTADQVSDTRNVPLKFHSAVCACLFLKRRINRNSRAASHS